MRPLGQRLGRNARFAAIGNGLAAGVMGACGHFVSAQAVFFVTAVLAIPTCRADRRVRESEIDPSARRRRHLRQRWPGQLRRRLSIGRFLTTPALLILTACVMLFHVANCRHAAAGRQRHDHALRPMGDRLRGSLHSRARSSSSRLISPRDRAARTELGPAAVLLLGFAVLPLRGALLAWTNDPFMIVAVQMLDGISGAVLGIIVPLALADISRGTGRFNLAQGMVGSATGIGAALSTTGAGYLADRFGMATAFFGLAAAAVAGSCASVAYAGDQARGG